jgi:hypothetical protein
VGLTLPYLLTASRTDYSQRKANWRDPDYRSRTRRFGTLERPLQFPGVMALVDDDGDIRTMESLWSPKGMYVHDGGVLVACYAQVREYSLDLTSARVLIDEPWCNDLHSMRRGPDGVLLAVSGLDLAVEFDPVGGREVWNWWAVDHGYDVDVEGRPWSLDRTADHRRWSYPIEMQSLHMNAIAMLNENTLVATLLHRNELIEIDRSSGKVRVLLDDLTRPHAVRVLPDGRLTVADTCRGRGLVVEVDEHGGKVVDQVQIDTPWLHDAVFDGDGWWLADGANARVVRTDSSGAVSSIHQFDPEWCLYEVVPLTGDTLVGKALG